jgi:hypothetical protein
MISDQCVVVSLTCDLRIGGIRTNECTVDSVVKSKDKDAINSSSVILCRSHRRVPDPMTRKIYVVWLSRECSDLSGVITYQMHQPIRFELFITGQRVNEVPVSVYYSQAIV